MLIIQQEKLLQAAQAAARQAYAPYSHYCVGAAVLGEDGKIYTGCNVENASYGLTNCAERTALFQMVSAGCRRFTALAITARGKTPPWPCGACRQVMAEFCQTGKEIIYVEAADGTVKQSTVQTLLPFAFSLEGETTCQS